MRITVDKTTDTVTLRLGSHRIIESEAVRPDLVLDYDQAGSVVGFELLNVSSWMKPEALSSLQVRFG